MADYSRLTRTTTTYQQASLSCPFKVDFQAIDVVSGIETAWQGTACFGSSSDLESPTILQAEYDNQAASGGFDAFDWTK